MEGSQEKDHSFLGNDTFPNLYDTVFFEREYKSEYLASKFTSDYLRVNLPSNYIYAIPCLIGLR